MIRQTESGPRRLLVGLYWAVILVALAVGSQRIASSGDTVEGDTGSAAGAPNVAYGDVSLTGELGDPIELEPHVGGSPGSTPTVPKALVLRAPRAAAASVATGPANWALAKVTTASPAEITAPYSVWGRRTGPGPLVMGVGLASHGGEYPFSWVSVTRLAGGSPAVSVAAGPVGQQLRLDLVWDERGTFSAQPVHFQQKASVVAVLFFVVNGVIDGVEWDPQTPGVPFSSSLRYGTGAQALMVGKPSGGAALAAASAGAGVATYRRTVPTGIVGGMEWLSCQACGGTWTRPDDSARAWVHVRNHAWAACWCSSSLGLRTEFAGPAGSWKWTWSGVSAPEHTGILDEGAGYYLSEPVAAAYAPIGNDWSLFDPCRSTRECVLGS